MIDFAFTVENFEYWLLIMVRISCFVFIAPFLGQDGVPSQTKIGLSIFISLILYGVVSRPELEYQSVVGYAVVVIKEGITGLLIGLAANICNSIVLFAGTLIDMQIGLSMAQEYNPLTQMNESITGNFYNYLVMLMMLASNMYSYVIRALCDSYQLVPINGQVFQWDHLLVGFTNYMSSLITVGFRITLPVFACMMILNCVLGIMAKVAPQMNMFAVGMQMKVLIGLVVLYLALTLIPGVADAVAQEMKKLVVHMIKGMYLDG